VLTSQCFIAFSVTESMCSDLGPSMSERPIDFSGAKSARSKHVTVRNDREHPSGTVLSPICVGDPTSSHSIQALADIGDAYASDSDLQQSGILNPPSVYSVSQDDSSRGSAMPPSIQLSVDPLLQDENSMDSTSSLSGVSSASLSPSSHKLVGILRKMNASTDKKLDMIHLAVNARGKEGDYLASVNEQKDKELERKDADLAAQKHKTKSAEGKTAAQTRKVNIAVVEAEKERQLREKAEADKSKERKLREKVEADKSTLFLANA
jgi:hypothetical protein